MILFIVGIILAVGAVGLGVGFLVNKDVETKTGCAIGGGVSLIAGIVLVICSTLASVPTGHTGILTTFGRVEDTTLEAGLNVKKPWQKVVKMDNRVQIASYELSCFSSDIQEVTVAYKVNFQIDRANAQTIYRTIGKEYENTVLYPRVQEAVKAIIAKYTAEQLVGNREIFSKQIEDLLRSDIAEYNIQIVATAVSDIDFTDAFTNAVEAKQVAAQNKLRAETEQAQKTMEQEQSAERAKIQALADAEVAKTEANAAAEVAKIAASADLEVQKINADAAEYTGQKEAAKNKVLSENLNEQLLRYYYIQQWDGRLPAVQAGEGAGMLLNVESLLENSGVDSAK